MIRTSSSSILLPQYLYFHSQLFHLFSLLIFFQALFLLSSRSVVSDSATQLSIPGSAALQVPLPSTTSQSLLIFMSIESVMLSTHLILCHPLLLLPSTSFSASGSFPMSLLFKITGFLHNCITLSPNLQMGDMFVGLCRYMVYSQTGFSSREVEEKNQVFQNKEGCILMIQSFNIPQCSVELTFFFSPHSIHLIQSVVEIHYLKLRFAFTLSNPRSTVCSILPPTKPLLCLKNCPQSKSHCSSLAQW